MGLSARIGVPEKAKVCLRGVIDLVKRLRCGDTAVAISYNLVGGIQPQVSIADIPIVHE